MLEHRAYTNSRVDHASPFALRFASADLRQNEELVRDAVSRNGYALQYADPGFWEDLDMVQLAVAQVGGYLSFQSSDRLLIFKAGLENDIEFLSVPRNETYS